jgi:hypothetical protein
MSAPTRVGGPGPGSNYLSTEVYTLEKRHLRSTLMFFEKHGLLFPAGLAIVLQKKK